jgi:hypothetical protein
LVADALKKVPGMLNQAHNDHIKIAFQVFHSFLELVGGKATNSCKLPYAVVLGFMSMEAWPAVKMVGGVAEYVRPCQSQDGSCIMTRIIRTGALPALYRWTFHTCIHTVLPVRICNL